MQLVFHRDMSAFMLLVGDLCQLVQHSVYMVELAKVRQVGQAGCIPCRSVFRISSDCKRPDTDVLLLQSKYCVSATFSDVAQEVDVSILELTLFPMMSEVVLPAADGATPAFRDFATFQDPAAAHQLTVRMYILVMNVSLFNSLLAGAFRRHLFAACSATCLLRALMCSFIGTRRCQLSGFAS